MNGRVLEAKVNKIMKIKNKDYLAQSNILETIKRGIRKGDITTEKQIKELALIYEVTGRELLISGHKKDGDYYTAYVKGKFKPHHIKFMKDTPYIASKLYDTTRQGEPRAPARAAPRRRGLAGNGCRAPRRGSGRRGPGTRGSTCRRRRRRRPPPTPRGSCGC